MSKALVHLAPVNASARYREWELKSEIGDSERQDYEQMNGNEYILTYDTNRV